MITDPAHEVILGGLNLMLDGKPVDYPEGYRLKVMGAETNWGNPQPVISTLLSMLSAGSLVSRDGDDNRSPVLLVQISCDMPDGQALAAGESAWRGVCTRPTTLEWLPPQPGAARAVFDVVDSSLEHVMDEVGEVLIKRTWRVLMSALPHARSESLTVTPAVVAGSAVVVNNGSSATGWTAPRPAGAAVSVVSGAVVSTYNPAMNSGEFFGTALRLTQTVDTSVTKYLAVDWKSSIPVYIGLRVNDGAANLPEVRREPIAGGYTRSYFYVDSFMSRVGAGVDSVTVLEFGTVHPAQPAGSATLSIDQVDRMNALPSTGTSRQLTRVVQVGGSVPTYGSIDVVHPTAPFGMGRIIVYTYPGASPFNPALSPWTSTSGTLTTDADTYSGRTFPLATLTEFLVPATAVPEGEVELVLRMRNTTSSGPVNITWGADCRQSGLYVGGFENGATLVQAPLNEWRFQTLGVVNLPPSRIGPAGFVRVYVHQDTSTYTDTAIGDELWVLHTSGSLTMLDAGLMKRLRINAPSLEEPSGSIWLANNEDFSDAYSASLLCDSRQHHTLTPGTNMIFTAVDALGAEVSATHFDRWHTHPAS